MKKVLMVNGSPRIHGCTFTALTEVADTLKAEGVDCDFYWIGNKPVAGCIGCNRCEETHQCAFDDQVNEFVKLAEDYDGFVFGSPVYYAGVAGGFVSFLDRAFYSSYTRDPSPFRFKPAAIVVSARRAGTTAALEQLSKYPTYEQMPLVNSKYWPMVHGNTPAQVKQDEEGMQVMRQLGRNMAWMLRLIEAGEHAGIPLPAQEENVWTNFIR